MQINSSYNAILDHHHVHMTLYNTNVQPIRAYRMRLIISEEQIRSSTVANYNNVTKTSFLVNLKHSKQLLFISSSS